MSQAVLSVGSGLVREAEFEADGILLSGLVALPRAVPPRAVLVALHGGGMRAGYFHSAADPALSLLELAVSCGYGALALDRPGYGASATALPEGLELAGQSALVRAALAAFAREHSVGRGFFLVGHSLGGKLALCVAADDTRAGGAQVFGVDVSGVGAQWAVDPSALAVKSGHQRLHWGPLGLYPPGTFRSVENLVTDLPVREAREVPHWPQAYPGVARDVRVPTRLTFAEHEHWWRCDEDAVADLVAPLGAPQVRTERLADAGHNISLGSTGRAYHLRVLAFLEECLRPARAAAR